MSSFIISPEITLLIADSADFKTLSALLRVSRDIYCLLMTYQHSIVKSRIQQVVPDPSLYPPFGSLLSSHNKDRHVLTPYSFPVIHELELREKRIDALFNAQPRMPLELPPPLVQAMSNIPIFVALPREKQTLLLEMHKAASRTADQIADLAVTIKLPELRKEVPSDPYVTERRIHRARQEYVRSLSPLQLVLLGSLACLCGIAYLREHPQLNSDPGYIERITAFKETVLRQGSFALWGFLHPSEVQVRGLFDDGGTGQQQTQQSRRSPSHPPRARSELAGAVARKVDGILKEMEAYEAGLNESTFSSNEGILEQEGDEEGHVFVVLDGLLQMVNGTMSRLDVDDAQSSGVQDLVSTPWERIILQALR
ncbi:hypothetical protein QBC43DRAFT_305455 [Cladorrhinum sp. PSN259]|nr:hypothetical protein QBC43DRAFT_305455 [Cladorrhinum sp. PSN259]